MKLVVLSNKKQYEVFLKRGCSLSEWRIFSDNPSFYEFLSSQKIPFEKIKEFLFRDQWAVINAWGCEERSKQDL